MSTPRFDEDRRADAYEPDLEPFKGTCAECGAWAVVDEDSFCDACAKLRHPCDGCGATLPLKELEVADDFHFCRNCLYGWRHTKGLCR